MDKEKYKQFHKKVRATGIAMLCLMGVTLIFLIVAVSIYDSTQLPLIIGLPIFLSADVTVLLLCYFLSRKDRDLRNELRGEHVIEGASPLFSEIYRDFETTHLESVWDSVTPNGWKLGEVYKAEDKIELTLLPRKAGAISNCVITLQFGEREVTAFFDYGDEQDVVTEQLVSDKFPDYASLVIWLSNICQQFADKAQSLVTTDRR